ncbi:MAG TPA: NHLP bacteriocin export ABC transporter permease/ATPase subunit [Thermotogota bacterium]|nr:NHLP bacteriocin export ABC transporter permease/ATPase subunit [Thermotogota bacterium]HRW34751.1 NHLP bacteriocin export ABC transporter permease/ATPase subunit [Thermotogota bacterium]
MNKQLEQLLKTKSKPADASTPFELKNGQLVLVLKGRADLFMSEKMADPILKDRLFNIGSFQAGETFALLEMPEGFGLTIRCINHSKIALINREEIFDDHQSDYLNAVKRLSTRLISNLNPPHNQLTPPEEVSVKAYQRYQKTAFLLTFEQISESELNTLRNIKKTQDRDQRLKQLSENTLRTLYTIKEKKEPEQSLPSNNALLRACIRMGQVIGFTIPEIDDKKITRSEDPLATIAKNSGFRYRRFDLEKDWSAKDLGHFLAMTTEGEPVAMIRKTGHYQAYIPSQEQTLNVQSGEKGSQGFQSYGYYLYRPFPNKPIGMKELIAFIAKSLKPASLLSIFIIGSFSGFLSALVPVITGYLLENQIPARQPQGLYQIIGTLLAVIMAAVIFNLSKSLLTTKIEFKSDMQTQIALWNRLIDLPPSFFRRYPSGEIGKKMLSFYQIRMILANVISDSLLSAVFSVFYIIVLFLYSPSLALMALSISLLNLAVTLIVGYFQIKTGYEKLVLTDKLSGIMLEMLLSITKIRLSAAHDRIFHNWSKAYAKGKKMEIKEKKLQIFSNLYIDTMAIISSVIIFFLAYSIGTLTTGGFVAFNSAFMSFQMMLAALSGTTLSLSIAYSLLKNIRPVLEEVPEITKEKQHPGELKGNIEFNNCSFSYENSAKVVIKDLNLRIEDGEYVAIVGASGSGKSTLMRLILGFEKPTAGKIYVGGKDLEQYELSEIRQQMGVVLQNSKLLSGDIFMNIAGNSYDITEEQVWDVCEKAGIKEDIEALPMGLNTFINDSTSTLSGGQKQRLLIARALLKNPKILLFDEATSALDNYTQNIVTQTLKQLKSTRLIIAHRLSTVRECDKIFVLDQGKVVESGSYNMLMERKSVFYNLVKRQII